MKKPLFLLVFALGAATAAAVHRSGKLDRQPPHIHVELPAGPLRGDVTVQITVQDLTPGVSKAHLMLDGGPPVPLSVDASGRASWIWPGGSGRPPGRHTLVVHAEDSAWQPNASQVSVQRETDDQPPVLHYSLVPEQPAQGTAAAVFLWADEALADAQLVGLDQSRPMRATSEGPLRALVGIGVATPSEPTVLTVTATDLLGNTSTCEVPIVVAPTDFPSGGYIRLSSKQVKARRDIEALEAMRAARTAAYTHVDPLQHWEGATVRPVQGRRTSPFGRYRTYSDGRKKHHLGTDLANITGTPVKSALRGVVRAAGWQHLFGNAVIVHHGQGLTSSYNHLSAISVEQGQSVEAGQVVGKLGSTGQSTGPHLHWGMQVGEVEVDPERWPAHGFSPSLLELKAEAARPCATPRAAQP